ncbi:uncharacterized protein LOC108094281 [Drosophila ficusphila]|uniref:uncharacterized protein LOC108094281 n=1 Tax=Drosophila ficusphila TaxID=30025 RepID=UPI0007E846CD|nr:uncharacterized protein LOC108094281 [Drosophila ficusphila]
MLSIPLLLVVILASSWAADYELLLEDPDVFAPCTEPPPGSIGIDEAFNLDGLSFNQDSEIIHISENITTMWDVQPDDRVSARFVVLRFNRGSWEPTLFSMVSPNFCKDMFDENQSWFKYWTVHFANREEIKEKCFTTRGTVINHKPFDLQLRLMGVRGPTLQGRYKAVITFEAYDERDVPRKNSICFEIRGEAEKIND